MMFDRDLYKTKLCNLYERRGHCPRQTCSFAHGHAELRTGNRNGRCQYRGGDLRDKLDRRPSPRRKSSPGNDTRGQQAYADQRYVPHDRGHSPAMTPPRGSERERKRKRVDGHSSDDVSGDNNNSGSGSDDGHIIAVESPHVNPRDAFQEQLQDVHSDVSAHNDKKKELEVCLAERSHEVNRLAARNSQLQITLYKDQEHHKRVGSKIRKFMKAHVRFVQAKDTVKKTQARLQKLVDEFPLAETPRPVNHGEESDVNVVSDEETIDASQMGLESDRNHTPIGIEKENTDVELISRVDNEYLQKRASSFHGRSRTVNFTGQHGISHDREIISKEAGLGVNLIPILQVLDDKEGNLIANKFEDEPGIGKSVTDGSLSPIIVPADKVKGWDLGLSLPSTGMAAHAVDENVEAIDIGGKEEINDTLHPQKWDVSMSGSLPGVGEALNTGNTFLRNIPPLISVSGNHYDEYTGDDEEVDVEAFDCQDQNINLNI